VECAIEGTLHAPSDVAVFAEEEGVRALDAFFALEGEACVTGIHEPASDVHAVVARRRKTVGAGNHKRPARVGAVFALGNVAAIAGGHVGAALEGAFVTQALVAALAEEQERIILEHAVFANGSCARPVADRRDGVLAAVNAPEPLARVAGQHVLRILRADLHAAVVCASLANHEGLANVALGDVELAAADERLQAADRLLVERVDAVHREGREVALAWRKDIPPEGARVDARAALETEALEPAAVAQRLERGARELPATHIQHGQLSAGAPQGSRHILIA